MCLNSPGHLSIGVQIPSAALRGTSALTEFISHCITDSMCSSSTDLQCCLFSMVLKHQLPVALTQQWHCAFSLTGCNYILSSTSCKGGCWAAALNSSQGTHPTQLLSPRCSVSQCARGALLTEAQVGSGLVWGKSKLSILPFPTSKGRMQSSLVTLTDFKTKLDSEEITV